MSAGRRELLRAIYDEVARAVDGAALVSRAVADEPAIPAGMTHLLAVGKAAPAMTRGLPAEAIARCRETLVVAPERALATALPAGVRAWPSDHPTPSERSERAAGEACALVSRVRPGDHLVVLLSGGASALIAAPAAGLTLDDKRAAVTALARTGAPIAALNAVRKHLSAVKGGRLGALARGRVTVLALSDVIGDDPSVIGSGPFSPDPSRFAEALQIVVACGADMPGAVLRHLEAGARGELDETPKPGAPALAPIEVRVIAGPSRVAAEAERAAATHGLAAEPLWRQTDRSVADLADVVLERSAAELHAQAGPGLFVGNGEPVIALPPGTQAGRGGRSTHLAALVARGLARLGAGERVAFLAAGTDDRDGSSSVAGACVDGTTWDRARTAGLDPDAALARYDTATLFQALGNAVVSPGTSNLLDLHLMAIG